MTTRNTITVPASRYADHDDCLSAAQDDARVEYGLPGYDLSPRWADDERESIALDLPRSLRLSADEVVAWDGSDDREWDRIRPGIYARAQRLADTAGASVELYCGRVVVEVFQPSDE